MALSERWYRKSKNESSWRPALGVEYRITKEPAFGNYWVVSFFEIGARTGTRIGESHPHDFQAADAAEADWKQKVRRGLRLIEGGRKVTDDELGLRKR